MSVPAFAWAMEKGSERSLKPAERLVLIYLADKANGARFCWPGQETIQRFTGLALRTIRVVLRELAKAGLIRIEAREGRATIYHILREDSPIPRQDVPGSHHATPANGHGVTPVKSNGVGVPDPGTSRPEPRHITTVTPANRSPEPYLTKKEEPKRRAGAPEAKTSDSGEVGKEASPSEAPEPDPGDRPVDPGQFQALLAGITRGFKNNYPPRVSGLSPDEMRDALDPPQRFVGKPVAPEVVAALRRQLVSAA